MDTQNLTTSVVIPAWNASDTIGRTLESICIQSVLPNEILIGVDNCGKTLKKILEKGVIPKDIEEKVRVFWFEPRSGCHVIRNTLVLLSLSDITIFFDADDEMLSNYVEDMRSPIVSGRGHVVKAFSEVNRLNGTKGARNTGGQIALKKETFICYGGLEPWICSSDYEFGVRLKKNGLKVVNTKVVNCIKYQQPHGLCTHSDTNDSSEIRKKYRSEIIKRKKEKKPVVKTSITVGKFKEVELECR